LYSTGETLLVADEDEAWVFEMCALPDETYHSAWVAQKVPDGEIFVAANEFRIRGVWPIDAELPSPPGDKPAQLYSKLLFPGLQKLGWWDPATAPGWLDWLPAVSAGEYNHPYYSLRTTEISTGRWRREVTQAGHRRSHGRTRRRGGPGKPEHERDEE
jgi:dipeptidase